MLNCTCNRILKCRLNCSIYRQKTESASCENQKGYLIALVIICLIFLIVSVALNVVSVALNVVQCRKQSGQGKTSGAEYSVILNIIK